MKHAQRATFILLALGLLWVRGTCPVQASQADTMLAEMLMARAHQKQISPLSHSFGAFSMETAYYIQSVLASEVTKTSGPVVGYKVAYASKAAQQQFQMEEPARGPFYMAQRLPNGSKLGSSAFNEIMLETEVAFTLARRIDEPIKTVKELRPYVKWIHPAFDAGNFPYDMTQAKPTPADVIAIGTGAHVFVLGPAQCPDAVDVGAIDLALSRNGKTIRKSPARDVMGNPWNSLLWCVNHLQRYGLTLEPGMVVLTGTAAPAYRSTGGNIKGTYIGDCGPLGKVTLTID